MNHELIILASLAALYIPVLVSPGPNFLVVTQSAINQTRRHAIYTALGIASGVVRHIIHAFALTNARIGVHNKLREFDI